MHAIPRLLRGWRVTFHTSLASEFGDKACDCLVFHMLKPVLILPHLPINLLSANIKESVSIILIILIWIAQLAKHVKRAPYYFNVFLLSLMRNGPNMSTPQ